jgi:hypothetical protein
MSISTEQFKINLNQNLWGLVVSLLSLGLSEYYNLCYLFWISFILSILISFSVLATTITYTINYCHNKSHKK